MMEGFTVFGAFSPSQLLLPYVGLFPFVMVEFSFRPLNRVFLGVAMTHFSLRRPLALVAAALLLPFVASCGDGGGDGAAAGAGGGMPPPSPVAVAAPLTKVVADPLELTGRYVATEQVHLRPQVSGRIVEVLIEDGATVEAGQVLMRLEKEPLEARVLAAKANVQRSAAEVVQAQQRFDRSKPLSERKVLGQQAVDDAAAALAVAQASEAAAKAELNTAEINLAYATITAPIGGKVGRILETTGNVVQAGGSHLLTIVADGEIDVVFDLPDRVWLEHSAAIKALFLEKPR